MCIALETGMYLDLVTSAHIALEMGVNFPAAGSKTKMSKRSTRMKGRTINGTAH